MKKSEIIRALSDATERVMFQLDITASFPDIPFTPPVDGSAWLECLHFPNVTDGFGWNGPNIEQGIWQISLVRTDHVGSIPAVEICEKITAHFAKGSEFWFGDTVVKIEQPPSILTAIQDGQKVTYPVSIRYRASG